MPIAARVLKAAAWKHDGRGARAHGIHLPVIRRGGELHTCLPEGMRLEDLSLDARSPARCAGQLRVTNGPGAGAIRLPQCLRKQTRPGSASRSQRAKSGYRGDRYAGPPRQSQLFLPGFSGISRAAVRWGTTGQRWRIDW